MITPAAEIRRRALLAAAKVTLSLSALACSDAESPVDRTDALSGSAGSPAGSAVGGSAGAAAGSVATAGSGSVALAGSGGSSGSAGKAGSGGGGSAGSGAPGGQAGGSACDAQEEAPYSISTVDCCTAQVASVLPVWSDATQPMPDRPETLDAATLACCKVLVSINDASTQPFNSESQAWQQATACCPYLPLGEPDFQGSTCTPWGPPMPPAMPLAWRGDARGWA